MKNMTAREEGGMWLDIQVIKCQQMLYDCEESSASSFPCLPSNTGFSQYDHMQGIYLEKLMMDAVTWTTCRVAW